MNFYRGQKTLGANPAQIELLVREALALAETDSNWDADAKSADLRTGVRFARVPLIGGRRGWALLRNLYTTRADGTSTVVGVYAVVRPKEELAKEQRFGFLSYTGSYGTLPSGDAAVVVYLPEGEWASLRRTRDQLRKVLAHELTHALDPGLARRKLSPPKFDFTRQDSYRAYLEYEPEVKAHLHEVRVEFEEVTRRSEFTRASLRRKRGQAQVLALLESSWTWHQIRKDLSQKTKRRFYQMAANWLDREFPKLV